MSDPAAPSGARQAARERARELREQHRKQDRRRRLIVTGSIVLGTVLILAIVATVLVTLSRPTARGPLNMISDGIKIGSGLKAEPTAALQPGDQPVASKKNPRSVLDVKIYVDYLCGDCGSFMRKNGAQLRAFADSGAATVEIHPMAILTSKSDGTQYSLRAANAAACVAELSPNRFFDFDQALFERQPKEGGGGLSDAQLVARAASAKVGGLSEVRSCIEDERFRGWVQAATARALSGPLPGVDLPSIKQVPTILVNGKQFTYGRNLGAQDFTAFMQEVAGDEFSQSPSPTPTPSGSATPAARPSSSAKP
jgi:protein-disulfide isomerase